MTCTFNGFKPIKQGESWAILLKTWDGAGAVYPLTGATVTVTLTPVTAETTYVPVVVVDSTELDQGKVGISISYAESKKSLGKYKILVFYSLPSPSTEGHYLLDSVLTVSPP